MNRLRRALCLAAAVLMTIGCIGCGAAEKQYITCLEDMKDRTLNIGYPDDLDMKNYILAVCPGANLLPQSDILAVGSVASGKLDCYIAGRPFLERYLEQNSNSGLLIIDEPLTEFRSALGLSDSTPIENYAVRVNQCIAELRENGVLADMERRWRDGEDETMPAFDLPEKPEYILRVVTFGQQKPNTYMVNNEVVGFDIELAYRVAEYLNCGIQMDIANFPAMLLGMAEGKYDMIASNLYITEDRLDNMVFSDSYLIEPICVIVRADPSARVPQIDPNGGFSAVTRSFRSTFLSENRWQMILSGLGITIIVTLGGFILANLMGALFCAFELSGRRTLHVVAEIYSRIMQGTPIVVLLMLLYYVVFRKSSINGVLVAIIGFGLSSGASLAQLFYGGISAVNKGQKEAALALGLTRTETFFGITFPQTVRSILPGYFSTAISMMKLTSIVGYIAVIDLTKASDIIRCSTFDAFFPLISVAIIYFVIAYLLLSLMKTIQKKLAPKRRTKPEAVK